VGRVSNGLLPLNSACHLGDDRSALIDLLQFGVAGPFVIGRCHGRADLTLSKHRRSTPAKAGGDPMERSPADPVLAPRVLTEAHEGPMDPSSREHAAGVLRMLSSADDAGPLPSQAAHCWSPRNGRPRHGVTHHGSRVAMAAVAIGPRR